MSCTSAWVGVVVRAPSVPRPWVGMLPAAGQRRASQRGAHVGPDAGSLWGAVVCRGGGTPGSRRSGDGGGALMVVQGPESLGDGAGVPPFSHQGWGSNETRSGAGDSHSQYHGSPKGHSAQSCPAPHHSQASPSSLWAAHPGACPLLLPRSCLSQPPAPTPPCALLSLTYHPSRRGCPHPHLICRAARSLTRQQGAP